MATVTVADYSVEFKIPASAYQTWYNREYSRIDGDKDKGISPGISLKSHMIEVIEKHLTEDLHDDSKSLEA
jgi:hypothetical protein